MPLVLRLLVKTIVFHHAMDVLFVFNQPLCALTDLFSALVDKTFFFSSSLLNDDGIFTVTPRSTHSQLLFLKLHQNFYLNTFPTELLFLINTKHEILKVKSHLLYRTLLLSYSILLPNGGEFSLL